MRIPRRRPRPTSLSRGVASRHLLLPSRITAGRILTMARVRARERAMITKVYLSKLSNQQSSMRPRVLLRCPYLTSTIRTTTGLHSIYTTKSSCSRTSNSSSSCCRSYRNRTGLLRPRRPLLAARRCRSTITKATTLTTVTTKTLPRRRSCRTRPCRPLNSPASPQ